MTKRCRNAFSLLMCVALVLPVSLVEAREVRFDDKVVELVREKLKSLKADVKITFCRGGKKARKVKETRALLALMEKASPLLSVIDVDLDGEPEAAKKCGAPHGPAIVVDGPAFSGFTYLGYPTMKETAPFLDALLAASGVEVELTEETRSFLESLEEEVEIAVFVTPS